MYFNNYCRVGLIFLVALFGLHCEHAGPLEFKPEEQPDIPTLSSIQPLLTQNCALSGCHAGSNALMGLDLSDGQSYANLVGVPSQEVATLQLVQPNEPDRSYLITKIEGTLEMAPGTLKMPIGRPALDEQAINNIREWISHGALNN